jgi:hypothetical protein
MVPTVLSKIVIPINSAFLKGDFSLCPEVLHRSYAVCSPAHLTVASACTWRDWEILCSNRLRPMSGEGVYATAVQRGGHAALDQLQLKGLCFKILTVIKFHM